MSPRRRKAVLTVNDNIIGVTKIEGRDYISLTDMAKNYGGDQSIYNWMRNRNVVEFLGIWESIHNPDFKGIEFDTFKKQAGLNSFTNTPKKWITATDAIGIVSRPGRGGGTYAHVDIAFEFGTWISPEFKLSRLASITSWLIVAWSRWLSPCFALSGFLDFQSPD